MVRRIRKKILTSTVPVGESDASLDATELAKQLQKAIDSGEVKIETLGENVVINFPKGRVRSRRN